MISCICQDLDLKNQASVKYFFEASKPDQIYINDSKVSLLEPK